MICEVKILDKSKNYGKGRIKDGFKQIVDYTTEYEKSAGYLVVYNFDENLVEFTFNNDSSIYTSIIHNGKTYYLIMIYLNNINPSDLGKIKTIKISKEDIIN